MLELDNLPNRQPQEVVKVFLRRHWIEVFRIFSLTIFMLIVPAGVLLLFKALHLEIFKHDIFGPVAWLMLASYILIVFIITITEITDYWLDVWIVTNERVINTEQYGLFNRLVSEVHLEQIQDITSETKGFLETFMTYGDVYIQTAANRERFQFKNVDNPDDVKITISQLVVDCKTNHNHKPREIAPGIGAPATTRLATSKFKI
jgi:hypothetical protein